MVLVAAGGLFAVGSASAATAPTTGSVVTVMLPPAAAGESYTQLVGLPSFNSASQIMTATSGLPAGVSLSPAGVLSAPVSPGIGSYTIQADINPAPAGVGAGTIDIVLTVLAPGNVANMVQGNAEATVAPSLAPPPIPPLSGRVACPGYANCNSSSGPIGTDNQGEWMTQWQASGIDSGCTYAGYNPAYVTNTANGQTIGAYVDDSDGTVGDRETLITCAYNQGYDVILAGMAWTETNLIFDQPNGEAAGTMLEWYPYPHSSCNPQDGKPVQPPNLTNGSMEELGYITQQNFTWSIANPNWCSTGATQSQHQTEWNYAWGQVDGTYDQLVNPYTHRLYTSPYGDLVGNY